MAIYHEQRTAYWGNWGIDFSNPNPDRGQNHGIHVASVYFPVGTRGPIDGDKVKYRAMIAEWIASGTLPPSAVPAP